MLVRIRMGHLPGWHCPAENANYYTPLPISWISNKQQPLPDHPSSFELFRCGFGPKKNL